MKIRMDMLFNLAKNKSSNPKKEFQKYQPIRIEHYLSGSFIFFDINQSESSFNDHGMFSKFNVNQSELSSSSNGFFNKFDSKQSSVPSQVIFVVMTNQNEVFTDFQELCRSERNNFHNFHPSVLTNFLRD